MGNQAFLCFSVSVIAAQEATDDRYAGDALVLESNAFLAQESPLDEYFQALVGVRSFDECIWGARCRIKNDCSHASACINRQCVCL